MYLDEIGDKVDYGRALVPILPYIGKKKQETQTAFRPQSGVISPTTRISFVGSSVTHMRHHGHIRLLAAAAWH
jgi:hypothetical protein